ncbi:uncharacterized protein LOC111264650 isoform X1 [Varroa jacobsoni]|uniref:uncharacterized protein LOC111264650 isoform X1 n=1 Tax=Varroa jacobsoni TaxID=62625 RepID=UPI000BF7F08A|nr:uncharacterized protein LOC111264650 isoform X1 [Varroa jacobsoni]
MPALSSMWPSQLLLVAIFIQQTCFSAQMKAHLEGELTPRMDFSFQGSNPINHLTGALGNNVANLFNPMQAVNAAFNAINGILKPAIPLTLPPTQLEFSSLLGFPRRSNGASLFPHTNSGNPPMSGSGSGIASLSVHNLGTNQPASRSTNEASVSFHTSMNNSPTTNPGSFGFSISGNGLDTGSRESPGSVSTSISRANIRLDPDATASSGPSRPSLGINLASSSSSSGPENSEAISNSVTGRNNRHGFRGRNLQMPGSPSRVFGQSLSKPEDRLFRDSSLTHINLLGSTKNDHHISPSSHGSSSSNLGHSSAISGALDEIEPRGSVGFSTSLSSIQLPSPSFRESLGSTNRRSFTVVDNSNRFTTAYARPNERRVILHTGGGQPEEDIIEISRSTYLVSPKPATFRSSIIQKKF